MIFLALFIILFIISLIIKVYIYFVQKNYILKNNDRIKVYTDSKSMPSISWVNVVKTTSAKRKIKEYLKKQKTIV